MDILQIAAIGLISTIMVLLLKNEKPELAVTLSICSGIVILLLILDSLYEVILSFYNLAEATHLNNDIFRSILKIIGVGYISEFSSSICMDAGNKNTGDKIMLAGKVTIMILALPIIKGLISVITEMLP